ncbi:type II toxin-antitoxin system RelE family toxin [Helicobacter sp. T3_23-1059]
MRVIFDKKSEKQLDKLDSVTQKRIKKYVLELETLENPRDKGTALVGNLLIFGVIALVIIALSVISTIMNSLSSALKSRTEAKHITNSHPLHTLIMQIDKLHIIAYLLEIIARAFIKINLTLPTFFICFCPF